MKNIESTGSVNLLTVCSKENQGQAQDSISQKRIVSYRLLQWTWGLPQTMLGAIIYQCYRNRPHTTFHGASVTIWPYRSSMSLGMFLFLSEELLRGQPQEKPVFRKETFARKLLVHEYGHTIQSLIFGPFYLLTVGLPSITWANLPTFRKYRIKNRKSYYSVYPEKHADKLGERFLHEKAVGDNFTDF